MKNTRIFLQFSALFASALVLVYFVPHILSLLLFPVFCILFYRSKHNALWIAFFFLLVEAPGGLFSGGERADIFRLPIYTLSAGISITFEQLFCFTALIKTFKNKKKFKPVGFIAASMRSFAAYFVILVLVSFVLGTSFDNLRLLYRIMTNLTLFYSLYFLLPNENDFIAFFKIIFPLSFLAFGLQLYSLINGHQLITYFKPDVLFDQGLIGLYESRPIEMVHILMTAFFGSLYFLFLKKKIFSPVFLLLVNVISYTSIFMTATRTWFIAFTASYILLILVLPKKVMKMTMRYTIVLVVSVMFMFSSALLKNQFSSAFKRISTVELVVKGDITAGGTSDRFDIQGPKVMKAFWNSTVFFGAGFSNLYFSEGTGHVGYQNFLFNAGIFGVFLLLYLLFNFVATIFKLREYLGRRNPYSESLIVLTFWLLAILVINGSTQMIGYDVGLARTLLLCVFFYFSSDQFLNASRWARENQGRSGPGKESQ